MRKNIRCAVALLLLLGITAGCRQAVNREVKTSEPDGVKTRKEEKVRQEDPPSVALDEKAIRELGSDEEMNVERFVQMTILYRKEMKKWLETARKLEPGMQEPYIEKANRTFFSRLGTTEDEYLSFAERNQEELNRYMEEHPEILRDAME
jgi:hypothetical protein